MDLTRAVVLKKFGGDDSISIEEQPNPDLSGKIEVRVEYAGLNFADLYTIQGLVPRKLPFVMGMECAGVITRIGDTDTDLKVGQKVICYDYHGGMYRDFVRVPPDKVYPLPEKINTQEGAAIFVNYVTAYFALFDVGNLKKGETVLITSCAGGVGWAATQLAKCVEDITVVGTTSQGKEHEASKNGVDHVIPLSEQGIDQGSPDGYDLIISNESGPLFQYLQTKLRPLGRLVLIGANDMLANTNKKFSIFTAVKSWFTTRTIALQYLIENRIVGGLHIGVLTERNQKRVREVLDEIFKLIKKKRLKPKIHCIFSITDYVEAMKYLEERKNVGKVLITMHNENIKINNEE